MDVLILKYASLNKIINIERQQTDQFCACFIQFYIFKDSVHKNCSLVLF